MDVGRAMSVERTSFAYLEPSKGNDHGCGARISIFAGEVYIMHDTRLEDYAYYVLWFVQAIITLAWKLTVFTFQLFWWIVRQSATCLFYFALFCFSFFHTLLKPKKGRGW